MQKLKKKEIGKIGENIACDYLKQKEYKVIERNFRCRQGEIDIIAIDILKEEIVFIEVKSRTSLEYGEPAEAVDRIKQKHIYQSARYYIYKNEIKDIAIRLDIIEVYLYRNNNKVNHIKQAF